MFFSIVKHVSTYSNPWQGSRTPPGFWPHVCSLFSFVFRGDKARPTADPHSARGSIKRIIRPSLIFSFILSYERTKVKKKVTVAHQDCHRSVCIGFVSENLCVKLLPILSSATFRILSGHRCILNLPYVLRIRVLLCRSPSHQPSTSHHCVQCRWLGESSPTTLYCRLVNHYTIDQSLIEVRRLWFYQ